MRRPSHRKKKFVAHRPFTDREDSCQTFLRALETCQGPEDCRTLVFYGAGGQPGEVTKVLMVKFEFPEGTKC